MQNVISVTEARKNLLQLVDKVDAEYTRVDVTKNGKVKASIVSPEYLEALEETIYTLTHSMDDIREAEENFKNGDFISLEDLKKELNLE